MKLEIGKNELKFKVDGIFKRKKTVSNHKLSSGTTLPETNSSHLKIDGWKMIRLPFRMVSFQVRRAVSFREGIFWFQRWYSLHGFSINPTTGSLYGNAILSSFFHID